MSDLFNVSASPHVRSGVRTKNIMADVVVALMPASVFSIYFFGLRALLVILTSIVTCLLTEYAFEKLMKKPVTTSDLSALVTGLLLALCLPASVPLWIPMLGGVFAILIVKQLFGGLGQNFMNPALAARCFLLISFPMLMNSFMIPQVSDAITYGAAGLDGLSSATPLFALKESGSVSLLEMFIGRTGGTIGETSTAALLLGAIYLLVRRVISWRIPVAYLVTFGLFVIVFGGNGLDLAFLAAHLCGGGLMLGAFFMATDYVTSPITPRGKLVFGVLLGLLTGIFRIFGETPEGVSYAIILGNLLVPLIEKATIPNAFGIRRGAIRDEAKRAK